MADDQLSFVLSADDQASKAINKVTESLDKIGKAAEESQKKTEASLKRIESTGSVFADRMSSHFSFAQQSFASFTGNLAADAVVKSLELIASTAKKAFDVFVVQGVRAAAEEEVAINSLNTALAQNGNLTKAASVNLRKFADEMQNATGIQDDAVVSSLALLESITGLSEKGLKEASRAAIELSAVTGKDLQTTTLQIAKAFGGATEGLEKFVGKIDDSISPGEKFNVLITNINTQLSGTAASKINSFTGAVNLLSVSFGKIQEAIGEVIIKNPILLDLILQTSKAFVGLSKNIEGVSGEGGRGFSEFIVNATGLLSVLGKAAFLVIAPIEKMAAALAAVQVSGPFSILIQVASKLGIVSKESGDAIAALRGEALSRIGGESFISKISTQLDNLADRTKNAQKNLSTLGPIQLDADGNIKKTEADLNKLGNNLRGKKILASTSEEFAGLRQQVDEIIKKGDELAAKYTSVQEQISLATQNADTARLEREVANDGLFYTNLDEKYNAVIDFNQKKLEADIAGLDAEAKQIQDAANARMVMNEVEFKALEEINKKKKSLQEKDAAFDKDINNKRNKEKLSNTRSSLGEIEGLMKEHNSALFAIGKAAALAGAVIDVEAAVTKALNSFAPFVLAPLVAAAGAIRIARIAGSQPPSYQRGITEVPAGFGGDSFNANLTSGERVVPASSNQDLKSFLAESMGSKEILIQIANRLDRLESKTVVNIGGREIINEIRSSLQEGRSLQAI